MVLRTRIHEHCLVRCDELSHGLVVAVVAL